MGQRTNKPKSTPRNKNSSCTPYNRIDESTTQKALRESEARYQTLIERAPLGIFLADIEGNIKIVNSALVKILDSPSAEATKQINLLTFPLLKEARISDAFKKCVETEKPHSAELPYQSKWGKNIQCRLHLNPIHDDTGQLESILGVVEDITEQKKLIEALAAERGQLQALMDNIPDTIYFKDTSSRFTRINRAHAKKFGISDPASAIGKSDFDFFPKVSASEKYADEQKIMKTGQPLINKVEKNIYSNGRTRWISATKVPIKSADQKVIGIVGISRDITPMVEADEKQAQLLKELETINQELTDFAYIVSHDLKAPLRGISSLAEWIKTDYADKMDDEGRKLIDLMTTRVKRMNDLIQGILQYSRIGRREEERIDIDLSALVSEVIDMISVPDDISVTIDDQLPTVHGNKIRLEQVFQNLIGNAIKYMDKEAGKIHIGCSRKGESWQFKIADNGPGIEKKHFEKIFQIFQTLNSRDNTESTGVGLSVVKKIIELYGGEIWLKSEIDQGTTFYFTLPQKSTSKNGDRE